MNSIMKHLGQMNQVMMAGCAVKVSVEYLFIEIRRGLIATIWSCKVRVSITRDWVETHHMLRLLFIHFDLIISRCKASD